MTKAISWQKNMPNGIGPRPTVHTTGDDRNLLFECVKHGRRERLRPVLLPLCGSPPRRLPRVLFNRLAIVRGEFPRDQILGLGPLFIG